MGYARPKPERLAEKLLQIRSELGLSQTEMWRRLGLEEIVTYDRISKYETGKNEPPLLILLQYARIARIHMEALVDDELNLPEKLPGPVKYGEIERHYTSRRKSKR
jgi:transcriptional regulator with XRE-family HTH domain